MSNQKLRIPEDVIYRDLAGEAVILNLKTGTYFGLDPVGTRMWSLIAELQSTDKVVEVLLSEYEVEEQQARSDLEELIRQLLSKGLLRVDGEALSTSAGQ